VGVIADVGMGSVWLLMVAGGIVVVALLVGLIFRLRNRR
jgi:hypothetical protein